MGLTVADMNRLEEAARLSMGGVQEADATMVPPSKGRPFTRPALLVVAALLVLVAACHLL